ncbi:hypothetical protein AVEN_16261-1 [Araneus ventricosus]|uniref:Uncharacterized protein n=1 Tax=Araneus ventricosus TaxID=182803 RepID=A0A4Y2VLV0_ARAVE|nr:hypothetical protein AVEN_16261-1 [Araneus ventricosus]
MYGIQTESRDVKIFEILGGPDYFADLLTKEQFNANGIVFMYAINDPSSFQMLTDKWCKGLTDNGCWKLQPTILVGNKRDLREDQQVIQRLALDNQAPVTEEEGNGIKVANSINEFYECSSLDENDNNIHIAFDFIISEGHFHWQRNENEL